MSLRSETDRFLTNHLQDGTKVDFDMAFFSHAIALPDHPHAVRSVPRWRGALVRMLGAYPDASARLLPLIMPSARRNQRAWAYRHPN